MGVSTVGQKVKMVKVVLREVGENGLAVCHAVFQC
jgi:hypothetical protein